MSFMVSDQSPRRMWDIDVGPELPIIGRESRSDDQGTLPEGAIGFEIWLPIDFHMIEDFVDESSPIVNTDYRFDLMAKLRRGHARLLRNPVGCQTRRDASAARGQVLPLRAAATVAQGRQHQVLS